MLARDTLDCFLMPRFTAENCQRFIRIHNLELLKKAREPGRGVIMIISHFGRFFMLGPGLFFAGINFAMLTTVVDERHPTYDAIDRWYMSTKLRNTQFFSGGSWITTADDPRKIYRTLRNGEILLIALDGNETNSSERFEQPFLGGTLSLPGSIIRIAKATGARLVYAVTKDSNCGYGVEISFHELPCQPEDALALSISRLEADLHDTPYQWWLWPGVFSIWRPNSSVPVGGGENA
jgi:lauroyl/myristoyl acyltransferase